MRFIYNPVIEGDESACRHDAPIVLVLPRLEFECEGSTIVIRCSKCNEVLEEGKMYE